MWNLGLLGIMVTSVGRRNLSVPLKLLHSPFLPPQDSAYTAVPLIKSVACWAVALWTLLVPQG